MKIQVEIVGLADAIQRAADTIAAAISAKNGDAKFPFAGCPLPEAGIKIPTKVVNAKTKKPRGPRTGYVRPYYLAGRIVKKIGGDKSQVIAELNARFGHKLVVYDGNRKGFPKAVSNAIFAIYTK